VRNSNRRPFCPFSHGSLNYRKNPTGVSRRSSVALSTRGVISCAKTVLNLATARLHDCTGLEISDEHTLKDERD
jgi:hypothetical protein